MAPELAARYPSIRTYSGIGVDDPTARARFALTPKGFTAQVLSDDGTWYVDPSHGPARRGTCRTGVTTWWSNTTSPRSA